MKNGDRIVPSAPRPLAGVSRLAQRGLELAERLSSTPLAPPYGLVFSVDGYVHNVAFLPSGFHAVSHAFSRNKVTDDALDLWDIELARKTRRLPGLVGSVDQVAVSGNGGVIACAGSGVLIVWDIETERELTRIRVPGLLATSMGCSEDGNLVVSGNREGRICLWDVESGAEVGRFETGYWLEETAFMPDGRHLVSCGARAVNVWDCRSMKETSHLKGHTDFVTSVAVSRDCRLAVSGSKDRSVRLWDIQDGRQLHVFQGHTDSLKAVDFSPDGQFIASGGMDKTIRIWGVAEKRELHRLEGHSDWVQGVTYSPDGKRIASYGKDQSVGLWKLFDQHIGTVPKGHCPTLFRLDERAADGD